MMAAELFIYYTVHPQHCDALRVRVDALQAQLRAEHPGLMARLLCRVDDTGRSSPTWMETYAHPLGMQAPLRTLIEQAGHALPSHFIHGARHTEVFAPCV